MVIHWVSCHRFPISNLNYELNDVISATFYVQISTQNAEKTKNSKATNPGELDSLWALDKGYWYIDNNISLETSIDLFHHTHCTHLVYEAVVPRGLFRLTTAMNGYPFAGLFPTLLTSRSVKHLRHSSALKFLPHHLYKKRGTCLLYYIDL